MSRGLPPETVQRLAQIFDSKDWPMHNPDSLDDPGLFDRFCQLFSMLSPAEQELMMLLTEDFFRCTFYHYPYLMRSALGQLDPLLVNRAERVFLLPLVSPQDAERGESKSGDFLLYPALRHVIPSLPLLRNKDVKAIETLTALNRHHSNRHNSLLLFLDDFIGTGETASKTLDAYRRLYGVEDDSVVVVALVAQERGMNAIRDLGFEVVAAHVRKRGISDSAKISDIGEAFAIMDAIEGELLVVQQYRRGYGQSEALVKMIRTPDNTFPAYWWTKTREGTPWPAPFRR